jgi:hypothetical protein
LQDWYAACREEELPEKHGIPAMPNIIYKQSGWVSYTDWLGIEDKPDPVRGAE